MPLSTGATVTAEGPASEKLAFTHRAAGPGAAATWKRSRVVAHVSHASAVSKRKTPRPSSVAKATVTLPPGAASVAETGVGGPQRLVAVRLTTPGLAGHCSAYCVWIIASARRRPSSALRRECTCAGG